MCLGLFFERRGDPPPPPPPREKSDFFQPIRFVEAIMPLNGAKSVHIAPWHSLVCIFFFKVLRKV